MAVTLHNAESSEDASLGSKHEQKIKTRRNNTSAGQHELHAHNNSMHPCGCTWKWRSKTAKSPHPHLSTGCRSMGASTTKSAVSGTPAISAR
jgi:hypothetical protein